MKGKPLEMSLLFDFYGETLTEKQRELFDLYYNEDLSLAEIAEHAGITRQGVRDSIKRAEHALGEMESKLGLVARYGDTERCAGELREEVSRLRTLNIDTLHSPEAEAIAFAAQGDYDGFYESELLHRNIMNYPPYSDLIAVSFTDGEKYRPGDRTAMEYAEDFKGKLENMQNLPDKSMIYRPREEVLRGNTERKRVTFLIKAPKGSRSGFIQMYMRYRDRMIQQKSTIYIEIDVNPYGIV